MTRTAMSLASAAVAGVLVTGLAGCSTAREAGAAVVVEDTAIPHSRVQELAEELRETGFTELDVNPRSPEQAPFGPGGISRAVVEMLVQSELLRRVAAEEGVTVTDGQVDEVLAELVNQVGGSREEALGFFAQNAAVPPSYIEDFARDALLAQALRQTLGEPVEQTVPQAAEELGVDVEVNPRYGAYDSFRIAPLLSGGLATDDAEEAGPGTAG